jgi:hypothetical protein
LSQECAVSEQAPSIHRGGGREVSRFEGEERLVVGRHSTFLSKEEHRVATGALFYKVEGEKHCVIRKAVLVTVEAVSWRTQVLLQCAFQKLLMPCFLLYMLQNTYLGLLTNLLFDIALDVCRAAQI